MRRTFVLIMLLWHWVLFAQNLEVMVQTQFPSPYLSDWETQPNIITARVFNPNPTTETYYIKARLESDRSGLLFEGTTEPFQVLGGGIYQLDNTSLVDVNTGTLNDAVVSQVRATNQIPEGIYSLSVELYREGETVPIDGPVIENFYILGFDRIELLSPSPEEVINNESEMIFQWTPVVEGLSTFSVRYHISIFEIQPGQIPYQVITSAYPVYETDVINQSELIYPIDGYGRFDRGKRYIWYVQAFNNNPGPNMNEPLGENEGRSEIWSFFYQERTDEATDLASLDRLELISGVAYLKNLSAVSKTQNSTEYILDGTATLVVYYLSDSIEVTCTVSNLSFLKGTLFPPTFTGGDVSASLSASQSFPSLSSLPVQLSEVTFSSAEGLRFQASFNVPGSSHFNREDLQGTFQLSSAGFTGTLRYDGDWDHPLFRFDHELIKVRLTDVVIDVGAMSVRADFGFKYFNEDSIMKIPNVDFNLPNISMSIAQSGPFIIPLIDNVMSLNLSGINGNASINASTGDFDFDLTLTSQVSLPYVSGVSAKPEATIRISKTAGFQLVHFEPNISSDLAFNLDYLRFGIQQLSVNSLQFSGGNFQFDFQFDAILNFGDIPNFRSPVISGIHIRHDGFQLPAQDFTGLSLPPIEAAGFRLALAGFHVGGINFSWSAGITSNWNFSADLRVTMPSLPGSFPESLRNRQFNLNNISLNSAEVELPIPSITFSGTEGEIPLGGGAAYLLRTLSGRINIDFGGGGILPDSRLDLTGELRLPDFLSCGSTQDVTSTTLHMDAYGHINGNITNFVPNCPINLGIITCNVTSSTLEFSFSGSEQSVILGGNVTATMPGLTDGSTTSASGTLRVNLITGEILDANIRMEDFRLQIPSESPILTFNINEALLTRAGIRITGTNNLQVGSTTVGVVFDSLLFNPINMEVVSGRAYFNSNFAFRLGINEGDIQWAVSTLLDSVTTPNTMGLNLPSNIGIGPNGLAISGTSTIHLNIFDQQLDSLQAQFSSDFALQFKPFKVKTGKVDFLYNGNKVATLDAGGIHFDLLQFGVQALPARLPLPDTTIAYIMLKQGSTTLVDVTNVADGVRISTKSGTPVKLVLPALKFNNPENPELNIEFSVVVDPLHFQLKSGSINASIPESVQSFDLSQVGIPIDIKQLKYYKDGGIKKFRFSGLPSLFGTQLSDSDSLQLELSEEGRFTANWNLSLNKNVPIMGADAPFQLNVKTIQGNLDFTVHSFNFTLNSSSAIQMEKNSQFEDLVSFNLNISNSGFSIRDVTPSSDLDSLPLDLGAARITFSDFTIPLLSYSKESGWDFRFEFSSQFDFPQFGNFKLPKIEHVSIGKNGIHFPQTSLADLNLPEFNMGGFGLKISSFRLPEVTVDIFQANFDFGKMSDMRFDLELNMPEAASGSLPPEFATLGLNITDAGFKNGVLLGDIQIKNIAEPGLEIPLGGATFFATKFGGRLYADSSGTVWVQKFDVTINGKFQLPADLFPCSAPQEITTALHINSSGQISGSVTNFAPNCPLDFGPVTLQVTNSSLTFDISSGSQSAVIAMAATLKLPAPTPGDSISASGNISLDLLQKKFIDGQIAINQPFRLSLPLDGDILVFTINSAVLNKDGLQISGSNTLNLGSGMNVTATFTDFALELKPFRIKSGNVDFASSFAFKVDIADGQLRWRAAGQNPTLEGDFGIALNLPDTMGIRNGNFYANGTATVTLQYAGETYNAISARFKDNFQLQFKPVRIKDGKVEFINNGEVLAYIDSTGFVPGNLLAVFPLPDSVAIPSMDVAYLKLKDDQGNLLVETTTTETAYMLQVKSGKTLKLRIPALAYGGDTPEIQITSLSLGLNKTTFHPVSGSLTIQAPTDGNILDLTSRGLPLKLTKFDFKKVDGNYTVVLGADIALPEALGNMDLTIDSLALSAGGISGTVTVGNYNEHYSASATYLDALSLSGDVPIQVKVEGIQASFSSGSFQLRFSGDMVVDMFKQEDGTEAPVHFAADVGTDSTNFNVDIAHLTEGIPLQIARLKPLASQTSIPPIKIRTDGNDFSVELNTLLEIPSFGEEFGVEVKGLRVSKNDGLHFPTVTFNNPSEFLNFQLFAMGFSINDLGFWYETKNSRKVFGLNLGGSITLMENTSTFSGLKIGTDGSFSIASASLLSSPLEIVPNTLSVQSLDFRNDSLSASFEVTPPQPLDQTPSTVTITVGPDGGVTGGGKIVGLNETQGLGGGDATEWQFWEGTIDLTYMVMNLDFGNISTSNIQFISDIWVGSTGRIELGYKDGGQVKPGLQIDFDGDINFANYRVQGTVEFNLEILKFTINDLTPASGSGFGVILSGGVDLDLPSASSSIRFEDLEISSSGGMPNIGSSITGGDLTIGSVFSFSISSFKFEPNGGPLNVNMGTMPSSSGGTTTDATTSSETIMVDSYVEFGVSMSMGSSFSGGVDRFVLFKKEGSPNIIIKNLHLSIEDVISGSLDLKYISNGDDFSFLGAGQFDFQAMNLSVVSLFERESDNLRFGIFAAVEVSGPGITVFPGVNIVTLGGGFFYNPKPEYLDIVMSKTDLKGDTILTNLPTVQGELAFAAFLYAGITVVDRTTFEATCLITITDQYIDLAGKAKLMNMGDKLSGKFKFNALFSSFYITGFVQVDAKIEVVTAKGQLDFKLAETQWYIKGNVDGHVVNEKFLKASLKFFVGNPGFMVQMKSSTSFNFWIVKVSSTVEGMVWMKWQEPREFGAFIAFGVKAEVLMGLASIEGKIKAILIISDRMILYGEASGEVCVAWGLKCWSGSIWVKISNKSPKFDGGFGSDPEMAAKIEAAENMANEMENAADQAQQDLVNKIVQATQLNQQQIDRAGMNLYAANPNLIARQWYNMENNSNNGGLQGSEKPDLLLYIRNNIDLSGTLQSKSARLANLINQEKQWVQQAESMAEAVSNTITQGMQDLPSVDQMLDDYAFDSPIQMASDSVVAVTYTDAEGREHQTFQVSPQLQVDESIVEQHQNRAAQMEETTERILEQIYSRILAMNENLKKIDFILNGSGNGVTINGLAEKYQAAHEKLEEYYMEKHEYIYELASFASSRAGSISSAGSGVISLMNGKNNRISDVNIAKNLAKGRIRAIMNVLYLGDTESANKGYDSLAANIDALENISDVRTVLNNLGRQLWFDIPASGITQLAQSTDTAVVNNILNRNQTVGAIEARQVQITKTIDKVYETRIAYAQALYDLCERYLYWQLGYVPDVDVQVLGNSPVGAIQGNLNNYIQQNIYSGYTPTNWQQNSSISGGSLQIGGNGGTGGSGGTISGGSGMGILSTPSQYASFDGVMGLGQFTQPSSPVWVQIGEDMIKPLHLDVKVLHQKLAEQLTAPLITSITVTAYRNPHTAKISASFNARHPAGISNFAYTITDAYQPASDNNGGSIIDQFNWQVGGTFNYGGGGPNMLASPQFQYGGGTISTGLQPTQPGAGLVNLQDLLIQSRRENFGVYSSDFKLIGSKTTLTSYFLPQQLNETSREYSLKIRARSAGGFVNRRLANFTVEFGGTQMNQQTGVTTMLNDNTAPEVLSVSIPRYQYATDRIFNVHVEAVDYESDVIEVAYTVTENNVLTQPDSVDWKSVHSRVDFNIMDLNLKHNHRYYVFVKVKNSVGMWSSPRGSNATLIDTTSPGAPSITFTSPYPADQNLQLPTDAIANYNTATQSVQYQLANNQIITFEIPSGQEPVTDVSEEGGTLFPILGGLNIYSLILPDTIPPGIRVHFNQASDAESGIQQYAYKITTVANDPMPNSGWHILGVNESGQPKTKITLIGEPLAYLDSFYVHVRAMNRAGLLGPVVTTQAIRPLDRTKPTDPEVNFGENNSARELFVASTSELILGLNPAKDNETGISRYEIAIGSSAGATDILNWTSQNVSVYYSNNELGEVTEPGDLFTSSGGGTGGFNLGGGGFYTGGMILGGGATILTSPPNRIKVTGLNLSNGAQIYVSVRAVNGDGMRSNVSTSRKIIVDNTPPASPVMNIQYNSSTKKILVTVTNLRDTESKIVGLKIGIKSTNTPMPTYQEYYYTFPIRFKVISKLVEFDLQNLPGQYRAADSYQIKAVTVNQANMKSSIVTSTYSTGSIISGPTVPTVPTIGTGSLPNFGNPFGGNN